MRGTSIWQVSRGGRVVHSMDNHGDWFTFSIDTLATENGLDARQSSTEPGDARPLSTGCSSTEHGLLLY
jgi:hypothetical protein